MFRHLHFHLRKRVHQKKEAFPHPQKTVRFVDYAVYAAGTVGPLFTIPQVWTVYANKTAAGLNVFTWCAYFLVALTWFYYGIIHKEKPIIISNMIWLVMHASIIAGIILY